MKNNARQVSATTYNGDEAKMEKIPDKSWVYFKRAHLHANGLGTASVVLIILVSFLPISNKIKSINAIFLGIASLGYSLYWMLAGLKAPAMGSSGLVKEISYMVSITFIRTLYYRLNNDCCLGDYVFNC